MAKEISTCIVDSCAIGRSYRVSKDCLGIIMFEEFSETLYASKSQFEQGNCNGHPFGSFGLVNIDDEVSDDSAIEYTMSDESADISRVFSPDRRRGGGNDLVDVKMVMYAKRNGSSAIITCDSSLIFYCSSVGVERMCFKAAVAKSSSINATIRTEFDLSQMLSEGDDPFFNYPNNRHCERCGNCTFQTLPPEAPSAPATPCS